MWKAAIVSVVLIALLSAAVNGQDFSIDPASPEALVMFSPAAIVAQGGGVNLVKSTELGLSLTDNIDGFSYNMNFLRPVTAGNPLAVRFSVSRTTIGALMSIVNTEAMSSGAAGDVFWSFATPGAGTTLGQWQWQDASVIGLTSLPPVESDVDGVEGLNGGVVPPTAYFSVDPVTAAGLGVSPADILYQNAVGPGAPPPVVFANEAVLGLAPGDDIDALAVFDVLMPGVYGVGDFAFVSLAPGSPTLAALAASPASIIEISVFAPPFVTLNFAQFGLLATDDINAITCYDIACCTMPGDANHDGTCNVGDAVYLVAYIFQGGNPPPCPNEGDANGDGAINVGDAVYLVRFVFQNGPAPVPGTVY